jgi:ERCC4-related helicase
LFIFSSHIGKTFIAAVVMYNFYRWYPQGKIIFLAPTKPLVAQQIQACYEIMGVLKIPTIEALRKYLNPGFFVFLKFD